MITAAIVIAVIGIIVGLGLGIFGEKFKVEVDEKEAAIRAELPGNNCGGCGYPGCDGCAKAICEGKAPVNACPVGGASAAEKIGEIMGVAAEAGEKKVAFVHCTGDCDSAKVKGQYFGIRDCMMATSVPGAGDKACGFGCYGFGTCVAQRKFDAIHIVNGVALVDKEQCKACGACIGACPQKLISLVSYDPKAKVGCSSQDKAKAVKAVCSAGCLGCTLCVKTCPSQAITMNGNVASIDDSKCTACGACVEKCPAKVIKIG